MDADAQSLGVQFELISHDACCYGELVEIAAVPEPGADTPEVAGGSQADPGTARLLARSAHGAGPGAGICLGSGIRCSSDT